MSETLEDKPTPANDDGNTPDLSVETVFRGTSVRAAKDILKNGSTTPLPHAREDDLGPISWFSTDRLVASGYGRHPIVKPDTVRGRAVAPEYGVVIEAEIPKSSDARGFNIFENGIEYRGTTRLVTELGMSSVAMKTMSLYEHRPTADGMISTFGKLIDEHAFQPTSSVIERIRIQIRRKKNKMMGRPTF